MPSDINRLAVPTLVRGLHVVVKPCESPGRLLFKEIRRLGRAADPMPSKPFIDDRAAKASSMFPARRP
jgi:hypothetical protein